MIKVIFRYFIYGVFAIVCSCGTRKVATRIENVEQKDVTKDISKGQVTKDSGNSENSGNSVANNVVNEKQESRITELFNENGTLKSRISELLNSRSTDKTTSNNYIVKTAYSHTDSTFNNTHYIDRTITIHTKEKTSDSSNKPLYWVLFGIGGLIVISASILAWVKWVKK